MPHTEGPGASLHRATLDSPSVLSGIDDATRDRLLELGPPADAGALLVAWSAAAECLSTDAPDAPDAAAWQRAVAARETLAGIAAMLPPSQDRLTAQLRAIDAQVWSATVDGGAFGAPPSRDELPRGWWHVRVPAGDEPQAWIPAPGSVTPGGSPRPGELERMLRDCARTVDLDAAQRSLEDAHYGWHRAAAPTVDDLRAALDHLAELVRSATPRRWPADQDLDQARAQSAELLDQIRTGGPGPDADDPRRWWEADGHPLALARALATEQDIRDSVARWAAEPGERLSGAGEATIERLVDLLLARKMPYRGYEWVLGSWEHCTGWSGLDDAEDSLDIAEFDLCPGRRAYLADLDRVLPPAPVETAERLAIADTCWEERTLGVRRPMRLTHERSSPAPWWQRRVPRHLPESFTINLSGREPEIWAELVSRGIPDDPRHNPRVAAWKIRFGMGHAVAPADQLPVPLSEILQQTTASRDPEAVRQRLADGSAGSRYVTPTVDEIVAAYGTARRLLDVRTPRQATVSRLARPGRQRSRHADPGHPWRQQHDALAIARAVDARVLDGLARGQRAAAWSGEPGGALMLSRLLAAEAEIEASLAAAAQDPNSALFGLDAGALDLLLDARAGERISWPRSGFCSGEIDLWRAGESYVDAELAAWDLLVRWAEAGAEAPELGGFDPIRLVDRRGPLAEIAQVVPPLHAPFHDRLRELDARYWAATDPQPVAPQGNAISSRPAPWWAHRVPRRLSDAEQASWQVW